MPSARFPLDDGADWAGAEIGLAYRTSVERECSSAPIICLLYTLIGMSRKHQLTSHVRSATSSHFTAMCAVYWHAVQ